ncbi:hypothetical protein Glove_410g63 [Diversispora epigaea]|uniref:Uncharacterized protein n=1 Tax=Diversispora epigaea TaxID=1348612 RepID=A0A397GYZ8_9GLOM|nr:hypothetical protein Glove_410g63 [Diversispora epigaea]
MQLWYQLTRLEKSYDDAINDLSKAIRIDPINCFALKSRAYCYYQLKSLEEALCDLNMVIILGCSDENTHIKKANIIQESKELNNLAKEDLGDGSYNDASLDISDTKGKQKQY